MPVGIGSYRNYYKPEWYINLGRFLRKNLRPLMVLDALTTRLNVGRNYLFPTKERDFRNFLNLMLLKQRPIYEPIIYLLRHLRTFINCYETFEKWV